MLAEVQRTREPVHDFSHNWIVRWTLTDTGCCVLLHLDSHQSKTQQKKSGCTTSPSTPTVTGKTSHYSGEKADVPGVGVFVVASVIKQLNNRLWGEKENQAEKVSSVFGHI